MINPCVWLVRKEDGRVTYTTDRQRADAWMRDARRKVTSLCRVQDAEAEASQYVEPTWAFEIINDIKARGEK